MKYYNLKDHLEKIDFREATIKGQGKEKGLFFPENIPQFDEEFVQNLHHLEKYQHHKYPEVIYAEVHFQPSLLFSYPKKTFLFRFRSKFYPKNLK